MTRSARWSIANGLYHVMNGGLEKRDIVRDDVDRHEWMRLLECLCSAERRNRQPLPTVRVESESTHWLPRLTHET